MSYVVWRISLKWRSAWIAGDRGCGLDLQKPITLKLGPAKLRSVLRRLNEPLELVAVPHGDVLLITSKDEAASSSDARLRRPRPYDYDVRDQRRMDPMLQDTDDSLIDRDGLVNLITYAIDGASWGYSGGPGSIAAFGGALIVSQTAAKHEHIAAFLARLRQIMRQRSRNGPRPARTTLCHATAKTRSEGHCELREPSAAGSARRPGQGAQAGLLFGSQIVGQRGPQRTDANHDPPVEHLARHGIARNLRPFD